MATIQGALTDLTRSLESYFYYMTNVGLTVAEALEAETTSETPDVLVFQFDISDIFDDVKMLSANLGKYAVTEKTGDLFDMIAITEEDLPMFNRFARPAAMYAYSKIQGMAKTIEPAFLFDEGVDITDWDETGATLYATGNYVRRNDVIYRALADDLTSDPEVDVDNWEEMPDYIDTKERITYLILNNSGYDTNVLRVWNENIKDIIVMYILEKLFKFRNLPESVMAIIMDEKQTKERELMLTISSRKTAVKRSVRWL